jgi:hypothetical protein
VTQLSKLAILGIAKETTPNTYQAPTAFIPFTKADFEDTIAEIKDESYRANDTTLQGLYAGVQDATWSIDVMAYPDLCGHFLRGVIGPDTVTAGVSTTLSTSSLVGATSISVAASIPTGSTIMIQDAGGANTEFATTGAPTGSGPYTIPIVTPATGLQYAHTAPTATVVSQSTHVFKQSATPIPSYSLTVFDTLETLGYVGAKLSDLQIKIDPKSAVSLSLKYSSFPGTTPESSMTPAYTGYAPAIGWEWVMTNAGASSTRGLSFDLTVKRGTESVHSSTGTQAPREIFSGTLDADGTYKAVYENQTDLALYLQYLQQPATATLTQPITAGGSSLALTLSKSGWYKGKRDLGPTYVQADYSLSGIWNATDGGAISATLKNFQSTAY